MTRSVLFDTETTGLDPLTGDRVLEFAAIELINDLPTDRYLHHLIHPERDIPDEVIRVHGITLVHVEGKPFFRAVAEEIIDFLGADELLVAHNAPFDFGFMNAEFARCSLPALPPARMIDTLAMAKKRFPGMPNSLDALCRRYGIDLSQRTAHNALLDCRLLAQVYVELTGGRQRGFSLGAQGNGPSIARYEKVASRLPRPILVAEEEEARHTAFLARLKDPIWLREDAAAKG